MCRASPYRAIRPPSARLEFYAHTPAPPDGLAIGRATGMRSRRCSGQEPIERWAAALDEDEQKASLGAFGCLAAVDDLYRVLCPHSRFCLLHFQRAHGDLDRKSTRLN